MVASQRMEAIIGAFREAKRIGLQLQRTALTVSVMPQKSRRQNATQFRNAQLSGGSCKPSYDRSMVEMRWSTGDANHPPTFTRSR
jgi:hypothetical protein